MSKKNLEKIIDMVKLIAEREVPGENYKLYCSSIRELTRTVWNDYHADLLKGLKVIDSGWVTRVDHQRLWFDCLGFPPEIPSIFDFQGKPVHLSPRILPSDFNEVCFHDSVIEEINYENNLVIGLKLFEFTNIEDKWYTKEFVAKLEFIDVFEVFHKSNEWGKNIEFNKECLAGVSILSLIEIPSIICELKDIYSLDFAEYEKYVDKRVFSLTGCGGFDDIVTIICKEWKLEKVSSTKADNII
jgi:hypothetical protein